eukprot:TRINITY_DN5738_c0_g2_i4.p1 TRINITY_DN5738_c0_g2~~TRINITY_DN5738_c0_g2_i4.p1  ORF type:complete len:182 (-),score=58.54 TRINITY_DN5738_c0_g2_i4:62-607(-)
MSDERSVAFRQSVDYIGLGIIDYPTIIKEPMDLSTVKSKLQTGKYADKKSFMADIQLIWNNCKTYNQPYSPIYSMSEQLEELTHKLAIKLGLMQGNEENKEDSEEVSFENKFGLLERIKELSDEELGAVLKEINTLYPKAIFNKDKKVQVNLDALSGEELEVLNEKLNQYKGKSDAQSNED